MRRREKSWMRGERAGARGLNPVTCSSRGYSSPGGAALASAVAASAAHRRRQAHGGRAKPPQSSDQPSRGRPPSPTLAHPPALPEEWNAMLPCGTRLALHAAGRHIRCPSLCCPHASRTLRPPEAGGAPSCWADRRRSSSRITFLAASAAS